MLEKINQSSVSSQPKRESREPDRYVWFNQASLKKHYAANALSVIEILIAVAIIAVMASTAVLSFRGVMNGSRLAQAAERIAADLRQTQTSALKDQKSYILLFNLDQCSYAASNVPSAINPGRSIQTSLVEFGFNSADITIVPAAYAQNGIRFDPYGQVPEDVTITLTLDRRTTIIRVRSTGQIDIQK